MYNGLTNYETWVICATIDNTESLYNYFKRVVEESKKNAKDEYEFKGNIMDITKNTLESMKPNTTNLFWGPLMNSILEDHINFSEIADHLIEDFS